ncbi:MAG: hypothetical protein QNJ29_02250 [Rhizobiaceae bacterium]|nr:hypothetical protein [Rhizobiaceae bacterium]
MADYYSILKKTIDGLPNNTPEVRQAVFRKARTAIETQLRGMSPTPSEQAIATQLRLLEDSILVVDAEYGTPAPAASQPEPVAPSPSYDATPSAPPSIPSEPAQPQQVSPPPAPAEPVAPPPTVSMPPEPASSPVAVEAPPTVNTVPGPETAPAAVAPSIDDSSAPFAEPKQKRGLGKLLVPLVILGVLGAGGYAIWSNKDVLQPILTSFMSDSTSDQASVDEPEKPLSEAEKAIEEDTSAVAEKEAVKLGQNGEDTTVSDTGEDVVRIIEPEPERQPLDEILSNEDEASGESDTPVVDPVEEGTASETETSENQPVEEVQPEQPQTLPIGEVAYLYEEGSAGAGASRINAAVTWTMKRESIADGLPPESIIVGSMEVPERNLSVDIEIKRNVDDAVSASHLIEMRFDVPEGFSGGGIDNIARFVMKSTEEARGEPLVAVPVKVSDGFFLIALDNLQQAVSVNSQLMTESSWIDVPISYATGKRALITLEKGGTGDQVFRDAFRDWENR